MKNQVRDKIKVLVEEYANQLPNKIKLLEADWSAVKHKGDVNQLKTLIGEAHNLSGTAGTYGYKLVSDLAQQLEATLREVKSDGISDSSRIKIDSIVQDLSQISLNLPQTEIKTLPRISEASHAKVRTIYILDKNKNKLNQMVEQLEQFNYFITLFDDPKIFITALNTELPDMVILDIALASKIPMDVIKKLREELVILIYTHDKDELMERLFTVRHGGQAFIVKPFEVDTVLRIIDNLFEARKSHNEHILIVDDSPFLSEYYSTILNHAGLITRTVTNPKNFLVTLLEFQPDLILMDINMPFCSGLELAQVVQQQETLSSVPIIFLSSISERAKQLEVLSLAGDDFLTKPIDPKHLLAAVHNRLIRSHILRTRMMRDSLTNLYNHTMIHHQLDREILIADRYRHELSLVLFDIDHFKKINDVYGHQAGDQILKSLSTFLQSNFRKNDIIGRYGGEEFLVILPNTTTKQALKLVDRIRKLFAQIPHMIGDRKISVTISGGIASYPTVKNPTKLVKAADDSLYKAKKQGRNRIIASK